MLYRNAIERKFVKLMTELSADLSLRSAAFDNNNSFSFIYNCVISEAPYP